METENSPSEDKETLQPNRKIKYFLYLSIGALGIVYGDIGTSPLYSVRECFYGIHAIPASRENILGVLSLIFWALIITVTIKYIILILRADNEGEGGILALMELVRPKRSGIRFFFIVGIGFFGAALLYGDGIITPAISVLSAVEGLNIATPLFEPYVLPLTIILLTALFSVQKRGTGKVGSVFGPVMMIWFLTIAALGLSAIVKNPEVFSAVNPVYAVEFFHKNGFQGFITLGAVFLVVTGGEALYADLGHFGHVPIQIAWFTICLPSLLLNYFGQGALLLSDPGAAVNPFYHLAPDWALYPLVIIATVATIIASQAVISGAFSLTMQALQLGYLPRMRILHTSEEERGRIYIPRVNFALFAATIALVLAFKNSSNLASAYGVAVTTTMVITSILAFDAMRKLWKWSLPLALIVTIFFLSIDLSFWGANIIKILQGGWVPLVLAALIYFLMSTWHWGRNKLLAKVQSETQPIEEFITEFLTIRVMTIPGTAIYMSSSPHSTPPALVHNIKHQKILHKQIIVLTVIFRKVPHVNTEENVQIENPTEGFYRIVAYYGFMDSANMQDIIEILNRKGLNVKIQNTTFYLGRETLVIKEKSPLRKFRKKVFITMSQNSQRATEFFNIPTNRVFEIGAQVEI